MRIEDRCQPRKDGSDLLTVAKRYGLRADAKMGDLLICPPNSNGKILIVDYLSHRTNPVCVPANAVFGEEAAP